MASLDPFDLKEFFYAPGAGSAEFNLSQSFAEPITVKELLALEPGTREGFEQIRLGYTGLDGSAALRAAIAERYDGLKAGNVIATSGIDATLGVFALAHVEPGDRVICQVPCYQSYMTVPAWRGAEIVEWRGREEDGWAPDLSELDRLLGTPAKWVIVNFPSNPTGFMPEETYIDELLAILRRHGATLLSDEIYAGLSLEGNEFAPLAERYEKAVSMHSVSKIFGAPGLRVGWLACADDAVLDPVRALRFHLNSFLPAPSEFFATLALRNADKVVNRNAKILRENAHIAGQFFARHDNLFAWTRPRAGVNAFPEWLGPGGSADMSKTLLEKGRILLAPSTVFDAGDRHFRLGLGCRDFADGMHRFDETLSNTKGGNY